MLVKTIRDDIFDVQYLLLDILSGCDAQISERLPAGTGRINEHFIVGKLYYLIKLTLLGYKTCETRLTSTAKCLGLRKLQC